MIWRMQYLCYKFLFWWKTGDAQSGEATRAFHSPDHLISHLCLFFPTKNLRFKCISNALNTLFSKLSLDQFWKTCVKLPQKGRQSVTRKKSHLFKKSKHSCLYSNILEWWNMKHEIWIKLTQIGNIQTFRN